MKEFIEKLIGRLEESKKVLEEAAVKEMGINGHTLDFENYNGAIGSVKCVITLVKHLAGEYNNGWIPCDKEPPPQPKENPLFDNKPLELYLVSDNISEYSYRAFWNGKIFTDGFAKVDVIAWQPLPEKYIPKGEQ